MLNPLSVPLPAQQPCQEGSNLFCCTDEETEDQ